MNWYAIIGRLPIWVSAVAVPTFVLIGVPEPEWWATAFLVFSGLLQLVLRKMAPKA